jgi:transcription antitermination factor NusB
MKKRRYSREITLKILYQRDTSGRPLKEIEDNTFSNENVTEEIKDFATELAIGTADHLNEIDATLTRIADNWKIERMAVIDRNILRIALFELLYKSDTPSNVIINEAIEIAKKYGDSKSYQFINGILDKAAKEIRKDINITKVTNIV